MSDIALREEGKELTGWRGTLEKAMPEIEHLLPATVTIDKFKRVTANAIATTPQLRQAMQDNPMNVIKELVKSATDGLMPDGREAALVPFNSKDGTMVTYMPMRQGVVKKIRDYPGVAGLRTRVVYENDEFWIEGGDTETYHHKPCILKDPGKPIGVYAIIEWTSGYKDHEFMRADEVRKVQSVAKGTGKAIWEGKFGDEMWRKTVLKRLAKSINLSPEINRMLDRDNDLYDMSKASVPAKPLHEQFQARESPVEGDDEPEPRDMGEVQYATDEAPESPPEVIEEPPAMEVEIEEPKDVFPGDAGKSPEEVAGALWKDLQRAKTLSTFKKTFSAAFNDGRTEIIEQDQKVKERFFKHFNERKTELTEKEESNDD